MFDDQEEPCFEDEVNFTSLLDAGQKEDVLTPMDTETVEILVEDRIATGG